MSAAVHIACMAAGAGLVWWAWLELNLLRGTVLFDYRYVVLLCAGFMLLSVAQAAAGWITARLTPRTNTDTSHE